jgi:hypothetical protein
VAFGLALLWTVCIWIVAFFVGVILNSAANVGGGPYLIGLLLTLGVALRDGYRPDAVGWVLLLLGPIGTLVMLWRRENQRRRATAATQTP